MPFKKRLLCTNIAAIAAAGLLFLGGSNNAEAQLPQVSCVANEAGDGWVCESSDGTTVINTANTPGRYNSDPSNRDLLPDAAESPNQPATSNGSSGSRPGGVRVDWLDREDMSREQQEALNANCCGAFVEPERAGIDPDADPATADTLIDAAQGFDQDADNVISISGDVNVQQGNRTIANDSETIIYQEEDQVSMRGNVVFREPGVLLLGDSALIDNAANSSRVSSASYVLHDYGAHGSADSILYGSDTGVVTLENGEFSRCEPENEFWRLEAESIVIDQQNGQGRATAVKLMLGDIPVFYYPFTMPFPLGDERASGLLAPSTGSTRSGGFDFALPYYFNLAPNYDATVTPRIISDRGIMTSSELRYLSSWSMNTLNMSYLGDDKLFDPATAGVRGDDSPPVPDRWFIGYEHQGQLGDNWTSYIDYNAASDRDYFQDLGSNGLNVSSRNNLNRQARLQYQQEQLRAGINLQRIEIIDPLVSESDLNKPYDRLPQLYFDTDYYLGAGFTVDINAQATSFDRQLEATRLSATSVSNGALVNGERINLNPSIKWALENPGWFLRSEAGYHYASYALEDQATGTLDDPTIGVGYTSLDSGLVFERDFNWGSGSFIQTLEPRLFYLYSEYEDQSQIPIFDSAEMSFSFNQMFRSNRFSGGDRFADANQLTLAVTSRFIDDEGKERGRVSVGQTQFFEDRLVNLSDPLRNWVPRTSLISDQSALTGELAYSFNDYWRINSNVQWNQDTEEVNEGSFQFHYQGDESHIFNVGYRYRQFFPPPGFVIPAGIDTRIKQSDVSGVWPIGDNWRLLARWNYDHSNDRNLESFAGIEYSNCCSTIRVIAREWVDDDELFLADIEPNRGIFVQFTLNGFGNLTGGGVSNYLSSGIYGFAENEY